MSRFLELCRVIEEDRKRWIDYRRECLTFAKKLTSGMAEYLQCPESCMEYVPTVGERDPDKKYFLAGAMRLDDDPFYHLGVLLRLDLHTPSILIPFLIRKVKDVFEVRIETLDQEFRIHQDRPDELRSVHVFVFELVKETYEKGFQRWLDQDTITGRQPFGFYRPQLPEGETQ